MSLNSKSSSNFIKTVYGPKVAVLCSQDAELLSKRNNLTFVQLLRPFCDIKKEIHIRDLNGQLSQITDLQISLHDLKDVVPNSSQINQMVLNSVQSAMNTCGKLETWNIKHGNYDLNINVSCPWYEAYRESVIALAPQKDNEFINSFVACLLVVSSSHPNPLEEFSRLSGQQNQIQHSTPESNWKWMIPNTLKYFVLLHDNSQADLSRAQAVMKELQLMHSNACYLLQINSKSLSDDQKTPELWNNLSNDFKSNDFLNNSPEKKLNSNHDDKIYGCCLNNSDYESLDTFVYECASKGVIPHMEKTIRNLNEQISSRKGLHRSIMRVTKSLFRTTPIPSNYPTSRASEPLEQVRKVADLCFLCQLYENAYSFYYMAKKEYSNDNWLQAASASEMTALSHFMQLPHIQRSYPSHYVESAIDTYINRKTDDFVLLRCILVSLECLRQQKLYLEATSQAIRLGNDENDLKCALLLEQVAHCFLRNKRPMLRKFAFYLVLAGHRYGLASQRSCALHCYASALQVYKNTDWRLALDHIYFKLGKHYLSLNNLSQALSSFEMLILRSCQSPVQQLMFLNEFLDIAKRCQENSEQEIKFQIPAVDYKSSSVRFDVTTPRSTFDESFQKLEDFTEYHLSSNNIPTKSYKVFEGEEIWIDICVVNNLQIALNMNNIHLQIESETNSSETQIFIPMIEKVVVPELSSQYLTFNLKPICSGVIKVCGLRYQLSSAKAQNKLLLEGIQTFDEEQVLKLNVLPTMPKLVLETVSDLPKKMMRNEIFCSPVTFKNIGTKKAGKISLVSYSQSYCFVTNPAVDESVINEQLLRSKIKEVKDKTSYVVQKNFIESLLAGEELNLCLWVQSNSEKKHVVEFVVYYEDESDSQSRFNKSRFLRFRHFIEIEDEVTFNRNFSWNCAAEATAAILIRMTEKPFIHLNSFCCKSNRWKVKRLLAATEASAFAFKVNRLLKNHHNTEGVQWLDLSEKDELIISNEVEKLNWQIVIDNESLNSTNNSNFTDIDSLVIAIQWSKKSNSQKGQSYINITELGSSSDLPEICEEIDSQKLEALHRLVKWNISCKSEVHHSFDLNSPCVLPINVVLYNQHDCKLHVQIDASSTQNAASQNQPSPHKFAWLGKTFYDFQMEPCGDQTIQLVAYFTRSGTFNINSFNVWALPSTNEKLQLVPQTCQLPFLISVFNQDDKF